MIKKQRNTVILTSIVILAFLLRFWGLGSVPASPNWDEVALGYNAYSISQTGRDEYGAFLPAVLRSYDDYKPALYAYLTIPSVLVFGLTGFAVRFPSALFGTLTVLAVYFLVKEIVQKEKITIVGQEVSTNTLALLSAFFLALSPWHLQFSRIGFESNVGVAFNVFATLYFLKGLKKPLYLLPSALCFGLVPSLYQSDKVFTPLLFVVLVTIFLKPLLHVSKKYLFASIVIGCITLLPVVFFHLTDSQAFARASGVSVFADTTSFLKGTTERLMVDRQKGDFIGLIFDNRRVEFAKAIVAGYLAHFDLNWLFIHGDLPRHHAPFMGLLYLSELPFLFLGIYLFIFGKFEKSTKFIIFSWFFLAPLPASITSGVPHAVRALNFLPTFQIFVALGVLGFFLWIMRARAAFIKPSIKYGVLSIIVLIFLFNVLYYLDQYFVQQNYYTSIDWQYGYKQATDEIKKLEKKYDKIIVTNKPPLDQSYMFFLFYLQYPPHLYQEEKNTSGGFREDHAFGKYEFRPFSFEDEKKGKRTLYVGRPGDFPEGAAVLKTISYVNGVEAIKIVEGNE